MASCTKYPIHASLVFTNFLGAISAFGVASYLSRIGGPELKSEDAYVVPTAVATIVNVFMGLCVAMSCCLLWQSAGAVFILIWRQDSSGADCCACLKDCHRSLGTDCLRFLNDRQPDGNIDAGKKNSARGRRYYSL